MNSVLKEMLAKLYKIGRKSFPFISFDLVSDCLRKNRLCRRRKTAKIERSLTPDVKHGLLTFLFNK